jgi:hypothetical protein
MIKSFFNFSTPPITRTPYYRHRVDEIERIRELRAHIEAGDYFRFHTTLLGFLEETLEKRVSSEESISIQLDAIRAARRDLKFLDENYRLEPRN